MPNRAFPAVCFQNILHEEKEKNKSLAKNQVLRLLEQYFANLLFTE
jgi:hypothetical protein